MGAGLPTYIFPNYRSFWEKVYVAKVRAGHNRDNARDGADEAVRAIAIRDAGQPNFWQSLREKS